MTPKTKFIPPQQYYTKNPAKRMRKLGDALLGTSQFIGGGMTIGQLTADGPVDKTMLWISIIVMMIGAVGKFLTNFYSEE